MHESALIADLVAAVDAACGDARPVRLRVRLGELSHLTPPHFEEHLGDTSLAGVAVEYGPPLPAADPRSQTLLLESVTVAGTPRP